MAKVKICGITNKEDALYACDSGVDALGFIFAESSPRCVTAEVAAEIVAALPPFLSKVGVFVNATTEFIETICAQAGLDIAQLHGDESPQQCAALNMPVIKAFRVNSSFDLNSMTEYPCSAFLLDTFSPNIYGGTGKTFDWHIAIGAKKYGRVILAGGLNPDNIEQAITAVAPYAVDISSGLEKQPGQKDHSKIKQLFDRLRHLK